jgi:hypothetical protein
MLISEYLSAHECIRLAICGKKCAEGVFSSNNFAAKIAPAKIYYGLVKDIKNNVHYKFICNTINGNAVKERSQMRLHNKIVKYTSYRRDDKDAPLQRELLHIESTPITPRSKERKSILNACQNRLGVVTLMWGGITGYRTMAS